MRASSMVVASDDLCVAEVSCPGGPREWSAEEPITDLSIVLVRSGFFRRRVDGVELVVDPMIGYVQRTGSVQQVAHPCGGDACTVIQPSVGALGELADATHSFPSHVVIQAGLDLEHRVLLARARRGADAFELLERAVVLAGSLLSALTTEAMRLSRAPNGARARSITDQVRQLLSDRANLGLVELARMIEISPFHLSRSFRNVTGMTLTRYRRQIRMKQALQRLAAGDSDLAGLAADLGFSDQAHFTRATRAEIGATPGEVRALLAPRGATRRI